MPPEVSRLGRTITKWRDQIVAWHRSHVSNGPTEAVNNLVKRTKRVTFGFRRFDHYRIRALLYAGRPTGRYSRHHPTMKRGAPPNAIRQISLIVRQARLTHHTSADVARLAAPRIRHTNDLLDSRQ